MLKSCLDECLMRIGNTIQMWTWITLKCQIIFLQWLWTHIYKYCIVNNELQLSHKPPFFCKNEKRKNEPSGVQTSKQYTVLYSSAFQRIQSLSIYFHPVYQWIGLVDMLSPPTMMHFLLSFLHTVHMELYGVFFFLFFLQQLSRVPLCCFCINNYHCWS